MKRALILWVSLLLLFLATSCGKNNLSEKETAAVSQSPTAEHSQPAQTSVPSQNESIVADKQTVTQNRTETPNNTKSEPTTETPTLPPSNGTMQFTDSADNRFIKAVHAQYNVDTDLLVAIYKEPADDSNCVWQFNGAKTAEGKIIRSADTLQYVYVISADTNTICRTDGKDDNIGMTAKEGYFTFKTTKNIIMPRFSDQLNGK
ncbi:MAG: hypothetical protein ACI4K9_05230 [Candidatus Fimenecus sp.]